MFIQPVTTSTPTVLTSEGLEKVCSPKTVQSNTNQKH